MDPGKQPTLSYDLANDKGVKFSDLKRQLTINQARVIFDIVAPLFFIVLGFGGFYLLQDDMTWQAVFFIPAIFWFSFWKHAYGLLFHEAAHYNLIRNKAINDYVSNIIFTPFVGMWTKAYRRSHWQHHKNLGQDGDTEISYQKPLDLKNIVLLLSGITILTTVLFYFKNQSSNKKTASATNMREKLLFFSGLLIMATTQIIICMSLYIYISPFAAIAWFASVYMAEVCTKFRQTLEHRASNIGKMSDFSEQPHGEVNKIFGKGFWSRYFGAAGFNRHLLHHLDPTISYTEFDKFENFLMNSELKTYLENNRTSYFKRIKELVML